MLFHWERITIACALGFVWFAVRLSQVQKSLGTQIAIAQELAFALCQDTGAEERAQRVSAYVDTINAEREKERKDFLFNLQNFGLEKDDPRLYPSD
jgi:hypothetical protein